MPRVANGRAGVHEAQGLDESWESHPAHFWLVLAAALTSIVLGYAVHVAARRRRDARLLFISHERTARRFGSTTPYDVPVGAPRRAV